jgi:hypothetical protein
MQLERNSQAGREFPTVGIATTNFFQVFWRDSLPEDLYILKGDAADLFRRFDQRLAKTSFPTGKFEPWKSRRKNSKLFWRVLPSRSVLLSDCL